MLLFFQLFDISLSWPELSIPRPRLFLLALFIQVFRSVNISQTNIQYLLLKMLT